MAHKGPELRDHYNPYDLIIGRNMGARIHDNNVFVSCIDLSSNNLTGEILAAILILEELIALNLSRNKLYGRVPQKIGQLKSLQSLDLSRNQFLGGILDNMAGLNFLSYLDLSYNYFSGRIPLGTQLQSFDASTYNGNVRLCGPPLTPTCPGDEALHVPPGIGDNREDQEEGDTSLEACLFSPPRQLRNLALHHKNCVNCQMEKEAL
ncbi:unnamed protein product, partial [Ilex paraguariensis]